MKAQVDERLNSLANGTKTERNQDIIEEVLKELKEENLYVETEIKKKTKKIKKEKKEKKVAKEKKTKKKSSAMVEEELPEASEEEVEPTPKPKKSKKKSKPE